MRNKIIEYSENEENDWFKDLTDPVGRWGPTLRDNVSRACLIAAKSSFRKKYKNACYKYLISHEIFSINRMELHPRYWEASPFKLNTTEDYVRASQSIIIAYSTIEELGFEIRAFRQKPSKINHKWNPEVKFKLLMQ